MKKIIVAIVITLILMSCTVDPADSGETLPLIPQLAFSTVSSRLIVEGVELAELTYYGMTPLVTGFDTENQHRFKFGETIEQSFLGTTATISSERTDTNIITFTIDLEEGEISLVYNQTDDTFDYTEMMVLHDPDRVMSDPNPIMIDVIVYMYLDDASLNPADGTFHGTGGLVMYAFAESFPEGVPMFNLMKYGKIETYRGGLDSAGDIGSGTFFMGRQQSDPCLDVVDFAEVTIEGPIVQSFATYKEYFDKVIVSSEFGTPTSGYDDFVVYKKDSDPDFVLVSAPEAGTREDFLNAAVPLNWQDKKLLDFPAGSYD